MEESHRRVRDKSLHSLSNLPAVQSAARPLAEILNTENAFKLCRVGVRKSKFTNFDLKYTEDEDAREPVLQHIRIPLLMYNNNKFNPLRSPCARKHPPHPLLVSRMKQSSSLPSIVRNSIPSVRTPKFLKEHHSIELGPNLFIT